MHFSLSFSLCVFRKQHSQKLSLWSSERGRETPQKSTNNDEKKMKRKEWSFCFEKNSVSFLSLFFGKKSWTKKSDQFQMSLLLLFILLASKRVKNKKFSLPSRNNVFFSLVFFIITRVIKRKRTHLKRERERESAADAWKRRKSFAFGHK